MFPIEFVIKRINSKHAWNEFCFRLYTFTQSVVDNIKTIMMKICIYASHWQLKVCVSWCERRICEIHENFVAALNCFFDVCLPCHTMAYTYIDLNGFYSLASSPCFPLNPTTKKSQRICEFISVLYYHQILWVAAFFFHSNFACRKNCCGFGNVSKIHQAITKNYARCEKLYNCVMCTTFMYTCTHAMHKQCVFDGFCTYMCNAM